MKKLMYVILCLSILFSLCACSSAGTQPVTSQTPTVTVAPSEEDAGDDLQDRFSATLPYYAIPTYNDESDYMQISIRANTDDVAHFGDLIYASCKNAEEIFENYNLTINFFYNNSIPLSFRGTLENGSINDQRSGSMKITKTASAEDIAAFFPALKSVLEAEKNGVSDEDLATYNAVMDALNDVSRSEQEIFEEIAPEYGMTASELETWMKEMMEKIY